MKVHGDVVFPVGAGGVKYVHFELEKASHNLLAILAGCSSVGSSGKVSDGGRTAESRSLVYPSYAGRTNILGITFGYAS
jgi:hypothetical protein